jgi:hypothetical protein
MSIHQNDADFHFTRAASGRSDAVAALTINTVKPVTAPANPYE